MIRLAFISLALPALPLPALAVTLDMPSNAALTAERESSPDSYAMPIGPWSADGLPVQRADGTVLQQAWRIDAPGITTLQLLAPLLSQLEEAGFAPRFTCEDTGCGGFDFRFATDVLPAPDMYVDLGDFRFIAFEKSGVGGPSLISLFASRTASSGYVQITSVSAEGTAPQVAPEAPAIRTTGPALSGDLIANLEQTGRFILSDLTFETGSAQLGEADFSSLARLANYLLDNPNRTIALVGHTDSVGSLDGNIALSKRRAGSVLERLVTAFGVPRRQLEADGVGYLTPIATNLTEEGRDQNRRVEAILTSTE